MEISGDFCEVLVSFVKAHSPTFKSFSTLWNLRPCLNTTSHLSHVSGYWLTKKVKQSCRVPYLKTANKKSHWKEDSQFLNDVVVFYKKKHSECKPPPRLPAIKGSITFCMYEFCFLCLFVLKKMYFKKFVVQ